MAERKGLGVLGSAGTEKSQLTRRLISMLKAEGIPCHCIGPTHCSAGQFSPDDKACTIHRFLLSKSRNGRVPKLPGYVICDEPWFVNHVLSCALVSLWHANSDLRWVMVGDPRQFRAPCDHWYGKNGISEPDMAALFNRMVGGTWIKLETNRRSCQALFDLCSNPILPELSGVLPYKGLPRYNLCVSDRRRSVL